MADDPTTDATSPATSAPAASSGVPPVSEPAPEDRTEETRQFLRDRGEQLKRSGAREVLELLGVSDLEAAKTRLARLEELETAGKTELEKAHATAKREADKAARLEEQLTARDAADAAKAFEALIVKAADVYGFAYPADVPRLIDLSAVKQDDGAPDEKALNAALKSLAAERKDYLKPTATPNTNASDGRAGTPVTHDVSGVIAGLQEAGMSLPAWMRNSARKA